MTPGARLQAAIDLLSEIHAGTAPADRAAAAFFRHRRYIGGADRRAIIDRIYAVLHRRAVLDWWIDRVLPGAALAGRDRLRMIASLALVEGWSPDRIAGAFDGGRYRPAPLDATEKLLSNGLAGRRLEDPEQPDWVRFEIPDWLESDLRAALGPRFAEEMTRLREEAAVDLRVNLLKASRKQVVAALGAEGIEAEPTKLSPVGLRVHGRPPLAALDCFRRGLFEVQDEGSQLVALLTDARPGMRVVDFCAGAGGKTLALAATMRNRGHIVACDVLRGRVERAAIRIRRAGVHNVERRGLRSEHDQWVKRHAGGFDRVLVDAPCTGSGTWRRNPDAKWRLRPPDLDQFVSLQRRILDSTCRLVKPGGRLIYATCSLLPAENEAQLARFATAHAEFGVLPVTNVWNEAVGGPYPGQGPTLSLTPARHGTDGFFIAILERRPPDTVGSPS